MYNKKRFQLELEILINNDLYKKNIIDESTFIQVNEILLKKLKCL